MSDERVIETPFTGPCPWKEIVRVEPGYTPHVILNGIDVTEWCTFLELDETHIHVTITHSAIENAGRLGHVSWYANEVEVKL